MSGEIKPEHVDEAPAPQPVTARHCWHRSPRQHTHIKAHADIRCCHCGEDRCVSLVQRQPEGHGPHSPREDWKWMPEEKIGVVGCPGEGE